MPVIDLTQEQLSALRAASGRSVQLRDPQTGEIYCIIQQEVFDRVKDLLESNAELVQQTYPAVDSVFKKDWDDPKMAEYDRYEEFRP
jgi:hypothetical protein